MAINVLISILCPDQVGLIAAVSGRLFELGADLSDTTFAVLGGGAEFTSVCELADDVTREDVEAELRAIPELSEAEITVSHFQLAAVHGPLGTITHRITVRGGDRPGLIARLSEVFIQFGANIVRLNSERVPGSATGEYEVRLAVWIPEGRSKTCLATVANTAGELGLSCKWHVV